MAATYTFEAARLFLLCVSLEVFATPTRRYHGRTLIHLSLPVCATRVERCLHTRRFETLASPPPPVEVLPWGPHPPGHPAYRGTTLLQRILQRKLVRNDGLHSVCQNSFLRCGQVNSVLCILLRSSMNLTIHLPRFL